MDLTNEQWAILEPNIPAPPARPDGKGRPRKDSRDVLNGILWVLRAGAPWKDLPARYPPYQTCHRRFQEWSRDGTLDILLCALAEDLRERGGIDLEECFIDGSFTGAKKGGPKSGRPSAARGPRSWQLQTALAFLSPSGSKALRRTRSGSSSKPSTRASS